jgi:Protein of unknown function (DUF2752)
MDKTRLLKIIGNYKWLFLLLGVIVFIVIYTVFDPYEVKFFPKCAFYTVTGYKCPGCGSQRAIHNLLNLKIGAAIHENLLLIISLPYLIFGAFLDIYRTKKEKYQRIYDKLFSGIAVWIIFAIIMLYWIGRNLPFFN